jgi:hypothetical protein
LAKENCHPPKSLARAVMMCSEAFRKHPNVVFKDTQAAHEFKAYAAYRRLNGDTFVLLGNPKDPVQEAAIRYYDQDDHLRREWIYPNIAQAWAALREWLPDREDCPKGWVKAYRRSTTTGRMVEDKNCAI